MRTRYKFGFFRCGILDRLDEWLTKISSNNNVIFMMLLVLTLTDYQNNKVIHVVDIFPHHFSPFSARVVRSSAANPSLPDSSVIQ